MVARKTAEKGFSTTWGRRRAAVVVHSASTLQPFPVATRHLAHKVKMFFFNLGGLFYGMQSNATRRTRNAQANMCTLTVSVLLVNAIAILSEDRFLARSTHLHLYCREIATDSIQTVGWGSTQQEPAFGGPSDNTSVKSKVINLISSVRTLMRSTCSSCVCRISCADFSPYSTAYRHQHSHHRLRTYTGMKDYTRACA